MSTLALSRFCGLILLLLLVLAPVFPARAEDGYDLWLRYGQLSSERAAHVRVHAHHVIAEEEARDPTVAAAAKELRSALAAMVGSANTTDDSPPSGALVIGTPRSKRIAALHLPLSSAGDEGFVLRSMTIDGARVTVIAANSPAGVLYGAFALLRRVQTGGSLEALDITEAPRVKRRMLNHWNNLDRSVERGYAGLSLWDWQTLPEFKDPRYVDYARANASIGINGTVINNVNSNADILTPDYLRKVATLADIFRPYGIRVYLSARFNAPTAVGGLATADPLDPLVRAWWRAKADEIYRVIPDFGGFLVKANSEGQPGPQDYRRTHADGANMLADAVAPHGGIVLWRAFVYSPGAGTDRFAQAYQEFQPLDGQFRDNVIVQVKNGPIDFQPREPFSPLFGAMPKTPLGMELQITKEYLGFNTHLAYLGTMWEEVLRADTHRSGPGSTVAKVIDGSLHSNGLTAMSGVSNIGNARNWSGSQFDQANWYAFGRLAWNPYLGARDIAEEWVRMTWGNEPDVVRPIVSMMMASHQAVVDYMTPLGLHHLMATGHHHGPGPWVDDLEREDWNPTYFHRADQSGIGFDRTESGSNALAQYAAPVAQRFGNLATVGDDYLLWFHHVPWDHRLDTGRTVWDELVVRYSRGVDQVRGMRRTWATLADRIDRRRLQEVSDYLAIQEREARWWRDAAVAYFQTLSRRPLPEGYAPPEHELPYYRGIRTPYAPGH